MPFPPLKTLLYLQQLSTMALIGSGSFGAAVGGAESGCDGGEGVLGGRGMWIGVVG